MTIEEYERRAIPRLERIDRLDKLCEWEKYDFQCSPKVQEYRETRRRLMAEQAADEMEAGL